MKQYLLGALPDGEASAIEECYFTDPLVFKRIREVEIELICAYLDETLMPEEHMQFENRYLTVPALRQLVDRVRVQRAVPTTASARPRLLWLALAVTFAGVLVIGVVLIRRGQQPPQQAAVHSPAGGISLFLEPGVTKGPESQVKLLKIPALVAPVSLTAELPGEMASADYVAYLKRINSNGTQSVVWTSNPIRSVPRKGGHQVTLTLDSSIFSPGDYILELDLPGGPVRETYVFRAVASSQLQK